MSWLRAFALLAAVCAALPAQAQLYDTTYLSRAIDLQRGTLARAASGASFLRGPQACKWLRAEWGWKESLCGDVEAVVFDFLPSLQTLLVYRPSSDGHVGFADWLTDDRDAEIDEIWQSATQGLRERSGEAGMSIAPKRWRVYPTLEPEAARLYYAIELTRDGSDILFLRATQFDRRGHVAFMLVPSRPDYDDAELRRMMEQVLAAYRPTPGESYFDARQGDEVTAVGTLGVFATLMGVQRPESVMAEAIANARETAKEFWYLSFLSIALFARKIFRRSAAA